MKKIVRIAALLVSLFCVLPMVAKTFPAKGEFVKYGAGYTVTSEFDLNSPTFEASDLYYIDEDGNEVQLDKYYGFIAYTQGAKTGYDKGYNIVKIVEAEDDAPAVLLADWETHKVLENPVYIEFEGTNLVEFSSCDHNFFSGARMQRKTGTNKSVQKSSTTKQKLPAKRTSTAKKRR